MSRPSISEPSAVPTENPPSASLSASAPLAPCTVNLGLPIKQEKIDIDLTISDIESEDDAKRRRIFSSTDDDSDYKTVAPKLPKKIAQRGSGGNIGQQGSEITFSAGQYERREDNENDESLTETGERGRMLKRRTSSAAQDALLPVKVKQEQVFKELQLDEVLLSGHQENKAETPTVASQPRRKSLRIAQKRNKPQIAPVELPTSDILDDDSKRTPTGRKEKNAQKNEQMATKVKEENIEDQEPEEEISQFEQIRRRNIAERERMFQELELGDLRVELKQTVSQVRQQRKVVKRERSPPPPRRKSLRIEGIQADLPRREAEAEQAREAARYTAHYYSSRGDWDIYPRKNDPQLNMSDVLGRNFTEQDCVDFIAAACTQIDRFKSPKNLLASCSVSAVKAIFNQAELTPSLKSKVVPSRIYSLEMHPNYDGLLVAAGCKTGAVGLWNVTKSSDPNEGKIVFTHHTAPTNCITFSKAEPHVLYTTSYDGTMRRGDLMLQTFDLIYSLPEDGHNNRLAWHCELNPGVFLVGQGTGDIARVDIREPQQKADLFKCYERSIRTISLHPQNNNILVTSSSMRSVRLWDMRLMKENKTREQKFLSEVEFKKSLSSAFFSPVKGNKVLTTTLNDISVLECQDKTHLKVEHSLDHNNFTGRWLTNFRAEWHPQRDDVFMVGSLDKPRRLELWKLGETAISKLMLMHQRDLLTTVGCVTKFHPSEAALAAGNSSGYVHIFKKD